MLHLACFHELAHSLLDKTTPSPSKNPLSNHPFQSSESMSYGSSQKVQKVMVQPINLIFRYPIFLFVSQIQLSFSSGTFKTGLVLVFGCMRMSTPALRGTLLVT